MLQSNNQEGGFANPLIDYVVCSATQLISQVLEAEVDDFLAQQSALLDHEGRARIVRNGYLPERLVKTAVGRIPVRIPRIRDRLAAAEAPAIKFSSKIIFPYQRRINIGSSPINHYLIGIKNDDIACTISGLLGAKVNNIPAAVLARLSSIRADYRANLKGLVGKHFSYIWVDRIENRSANGSKSSSLVVAIGENDKGEKDLLFVLDEEIQDDSLYRIVLAKLSELGIADGKPFVAISNDVWGSAAPSGTGKLKSCNNN
jgi:transposase-like protein